MRPVAKSERAAGIGVKDDTTSRLAVAVLPAPKLVELTAPVVSVKDPSMVPLTVTLNTQLLATEAPANITTWPETEPVPLHTVETEEKRGVIPVGMTSVIATPTNRVIAKIPVGKCPTAWR